MLVSLIAAVATNRVIGREGKIPWRVPADIAYFKRVTMGHSLIMGRKTFQAIGKPLPGRRNIVLTRDPSYQASGCMTARSLEEALGHATGDEVFVIGGAEVYALFLPRADRLYITHVDRAVTGDELFPAFDEREWTVVESASGTVDRTNPLPHRFVIYQRRAPSS
jgi:dihydrofolate reductase